MKINKKLACLFTLFLGLNIMACSQQAVQTPIVQNSIQNSSKNVLIVDDIYGVSSFKENLAQVTINGKHGFIDKTGKLVIPAKYEVAFGFSDNLARVKFNNKWGFINKKGDWVIPAKYDSAHEFHEDLAVAEINKKYGFINKKGEWVVPAQYSFAHDFSDGLARVGNGANAYYIDKTGKTIISESLLKFMVNGEFSEGLAATCVGSPDIYKSKKPCKYGYINKKGKLVIPAKYDFAYDFHENLALVRINNKHGFINKKGELVIPAKYDKAHSFEDGLALVQFNNKWGFINKKEEWVIPAQYDKAYTFSDDLATVEINGKLGSINKSGKVIIPTQFNEESGFAFSNGLARTKLNDQQGAFVNKAGETVFTFETRR